MTKIINKKNTTAIKLGGGGEALMALPWKKNDFFAVSLSGAVHWELKAITDISAKNVRVF